MRVFLLLSALAVFALYFFVTLTSLVAGGGLAVAGTIALISLLIIFSLGSRYNGTTTALLVALGLFVHFTGVFTFTPIMLLAVPVYLVVGLVYSRFMWNIMLESDAGKYRITNAYNSYKNSADHTAGLVFKKSRYYPFGFSKDYPSILDNVVWWPLHLLGNICSIATNGTKNLALSIGRGVSELYARDADKAIAKITQNL